MTEPFIAGTEGKGYVVMALEKFLEEETYSLLQISKGK